MAIKSFFYPPSPAIVIPPGGATAANQATEIIKLTSIDTNTTNIKVDTAYLSNIDASLSTILTNTTPLLSILPVSGPLTDAELRAAAVPVSGTFYQATQPVSIASLPTVSGRTKVLLYRNDYSSVNVTTAAYVQITASSSATINKIQIFDSSGSTMVIAVGAAASEVDQFYVFPGGVEVDLVIPASSRISIKAVSANATVGEISINFLS